MLCKFGHMGLGEDHFARLLSTVTGHSYTEAEMLKVGERIWTLERLYNPRRGFTAGDDTLPRRLLEEPAREGPTRGRVVELAPMLEESFQWYSSLEASASILCHIHSLGGEMKDYRKGADRYGRW